MILKNQRPIRRIARTVVIVYPTSPRELTIGLLRGLARYAQDRGRIMLSWRGVVYDMMENYDDTRYRVSVDTVYVGRRKCRSGELKRLFRKNTENREMGRFTIPQETGGLD